MIFSAMAVMVYMRLDMVMLKMMQGDFAVGLYAAATRISEVWYFIPMAIVSSCISRYHAGKGRPSTFLWTASQAILAHDAISLCHRFHRGTRFKCNR